LAQNNWTLRRKLLKLSLGKQIFFLDKQTAYCLFIVISFDDL